ncbi:MAG: CHAT domain-containing tetratricopeptide repeat protein [Fulvivirga sp.]
MYTLVRAICCTACVLLAAERSPARQGEQLLKEAEQLKIADNLEAFTFAYLDEFLKNPTYGSIEILNKFSEKIWRKPASKAEALAVIILYNNKGYYHLNFSQLQQSIQAYERAWRFYQQYQPSDYNIIEYCLKPLGNVYSMVGDYESAESIIKSYLLKSVAQEDNEQQVAALINLSIVYHDTGRFNEAIDMLSQALDFNFQSKMGMIYSNIAKNRLKLNQFEKARLSANEALGYFRKTDSKNYLANTYTIMALIDLAVEDTVSAIDNLGSAKNFQHLMKPREAAKLNVQLAGLIGAKGSYEKAMDNYQNALKALLPNYNQVAALPDESMLYAENTLKEIFDGMAGIHIARGSPEAAIACYQRSFVVEELLKENFNYKQSKLLQQTENRDRAESILSILFDLYQNTRHEKYAQSAFAIAEQTKSIALKDELRDRNAWLKSSDSLYSRKKQLDNELAQVENALIQEQSKGKSASISTIQQLINAKNELMLNLKELKQTLGIDRQGHSFSYDSLQDQLQQDGLTLIEYFFGRRALYRFMLNGDKLEMTRNPNIDTLRKVVMQYSQLFTHEVKINSAPELFAQISHRLYGLLLPNDLQTPVLIIPDGLLNFAPFEALLTALPDTQGYAQWPWLLRKTPIFYHYSADLYTTRRFVSAKGSQQVLGFFPRFADTKRYLSYSEEEAKEIEKYFKGDFYRNEKATKQTFLKQVGKYPIVHLSTHASAGSILKPPSISFIDSDLYLPEIYGLNMHTELMVLGACETGIGKLYRGEGPLSIAAGFMHAGVENIMLSLWKVNDYSTSKLMAYFYENYADEKQASMAVHKAKLDYLGDEKIALDKKSPYYWASFVYYGGLQKEVTHTTQFVWYIVGTIVLLLVVSVEGYKIRNRGKLSKD